MVEAIASLCIALCRPLEASKGSKDCVRQALAAGFPVYLIEHEQAVPRRIQAGDQRLKTHEAIGSNPVSPIRRMKQPDSTRGASITAP